MVCMTNDSNEKKCSFEKALDLTGFGKYNVVMLLSCVLMILAMYLDIFGFSVVLPAVACDMSLTTTQQGLLSAVPLIGVMVSSYAWGLCADTLGRRRTLLIAMPIGFIFNMMASMAPNYATLAVSKFLSASFTSSANAATFVLVAESVPARHRSRFMFLMASATMIVQFIIGIIALGVFKLSFHIEISWLSTEYRPWRLLMQLISLPGGIGVLILVLLNESPKFLLSKDRNKEAIAVFKTIYRCNTGLIDDSYPESNVYLDDAMMPSTDTSILKKMWNQTAPLFKPPLLKNSMKLYYLLLCAYMTSTGFTMWVPTMTNAYFTSEESDGYTFCEVASRSTSQNSTSEETVDCDSIVKDSTLYAVMIYSGVSALLTIVLSFMVGPLGKKKTTIMIFIISIIAGIILVFVRIPMFSIALFFIFLYVAQILGNVNSYLVELNPTHLRGMATCLSVVVARGFGFFSVQMIAALLADYCTIMLSSYVALVASGLVVAAFLPEDPKKGKTSEVNGQTGDPENVKE